MGKNTNDTKAPQSQESVFTRKVEAKKKDENQHILELVERAKEDPQAMLELSDIAYMQQRRRESVSEGQ